METMNSNPSEPAKALATMEAANETSQPTSAVTSTASDSTGMHKSLIEKIIDCSLPEKQMIVGDLVTELLKKAEAELVPRAPSGLSVGRGDKYRESKRSHRR